MRVRLERSRFALYLAAAVLVAGGAFLPTPFSLMLPGRAVDLGTVVDVAGHSPPRTRYYLTDVRFAAHATPFELFAAFLPGAQVMPARAVLPKSTTGTQYNGVEREAMSESQSVAAFVAERAAGLRVPIAVRFHLPGVSGSSGGLMFALDIYRSLRRGKNVRYTRIAGTGTIGYDGSVGPIEGARQKAITARNAGAQVFLVPEDNYREVAGTPGIRVVPVANFRAALAALRRS